MHDYLQKCQPAYNRRLRFYERWQNCQQNRSFRHQGKHLRHELCNARNKWNTFIQVRGGLSADTQMKSWVLKQLVLLWQMTRTYNHERANWRKTSRAPWSNHDTSGAAQCLVNISGEMHTLTVTIKLHLILWSAIQFKDWCLVFSQQGTRRAKYTNKKWPMGIGKVLIFEKKVSQHVQKKARKNIPPHVWLGVNKMKIYVCSCMPAAQSHPSNADISRA